MKNRWWVYQRERFPIFQHGLLVLAFSFSALTFSRLLRGEESFPPLLVAAMAFSTAITFFFQLRIADEFKDIEEDDVICLGDIHPVEALKKPSFGVFSRLEALIAAT